MEDRKTIKYIGVKIISAIPMRCPDDIHHSKKGDNGYKVIYADGYESWSPKDVFDKAYRPVNGMNFGLAIEALKKGLRVARKGWNGKGIFIELQTPDKNSKMTSPYIYINTSGLQTDNPSAPKVIIPWLASQTDMLAEDYFILN